MTLEELGNIVNCHYFMLRDWENSERVLTVGLIIRLAKYFGVTTDYLLGL
ncbi:MAG: helix-turn-helix transcriptional regulator [Clostridia bacterium]|nr:helix-turn-helix transcriptional regulator [Clostridia bacterium]